MKTNTPDFYKYALRYKYGHQITRQSNQNKGGIKTAFFIVCISPIESRQPDIKIHSGDNITAGNSQISPVMGSIFALNISDNKLFIFVLELNIEHARAKLEHVDK